MINIGNKKIKTLHKGSELITRVFKGDEKIYEDFEALYSFKFTVDTRLTPQGQTTGTNKNFQFTKYGQSGTKYGYYGNPTLIVDWGDGTRETVGTGNISHTYATAGEYQIMLLPNNRYSNGQLVLGWLSGLKVSGNYGGYGQYVKSIDSKLPEGSYICSSPQSAGSVGGIFIQSFEDMFYNCMNVTSAPEKLFDGVLFDSFSSSASSMFYRTFCSFGKNTGCNIFPAAKRLFQKAATALASTTATNYSKFFCSTFDNMGYNATTGSIPADLFDGFAFSNATNLQYIFSGTFNYCLGRSTEATIPASLFSSIDTSSCQDFQNMFERTFQGYGGYSPSFTIPGDLFSTLDMTNATSVRSMFSSTFQYCGTQNTNFTIPATLFSQVRTNGLSDLSSMFSATFNNSGQNSLAMTIPATLFSSLDTSSCTNFSSMFSACFSNTCKSSTVWEVPETLFSNIDTSNGINISGMFGSTFREMGTATNTANFPVHVFDFLDTANAVNLSGLFNAAFLGSYFIYPSATIPLMFDGLNTSNCTDFSRMFYGTFSSSGVTQSGKIIPANLFSHLDTSNGTNFSGMFAFTFSNFYLENIPDRLFSIDTRQGTQFYEMFYATFEGARSGVTTSFTIPTDLFNIDTSSGVNFNTMFCRTFSRLSPRSQVVIPAGLFSHIDTSNGQKFSSMFSSTFAVCSKYDSTDKIVIPATLFSTIDTTNATETNSMFSETFRSLVPTEFPQGLFGGIKVVPGAYGVFSTTFCGQVDGAQTQKTTNLNSELKDVFDGMTDFSWATAANASNTLYSMFGYFSSYYNDATVGAASTILQHFNFTPDARTRMFEGRKGLTDYNTINSNWK